MHKHLWFHDIENLSHYLRVAEEEDHWLAFNTCFHHNFSKVIFPLVNAIVLWQLDLKAVIFHPETQDDWSICTQSYPVLKHSSEHYGSPVITSNNNIILTPLVFEWMGAGVRTRFSAVFVDIIVFCIYGYCVNSNSLFFGWWGQEMRVTRRGLPTTWPFPKLGNVC